MRARDALAGLVCVAASALAWALARPSADAPPAPTPRQTAVNGRWRGVRWSGVQSPAKGPGRAPGGPPAAHGPGTDALDRRPLPELYAAPASGPTSLRARTAPAPPRRPWAVPGPPPTPPLPSLQSPPPRVNSESE